MVFWGAIEPLRSTGAGSTWEPTLSGPSASTIWIPGAEWTRVRGAARPGKIDYREVLSPEDFAVFARLRQLRKEIAQAEAVPVYTIFTNDQLAQMVQSRATTKAALEKIAGVGDARIEKYGPRVLEFLARQWDGNEAMRGAHHLFEQIVERENLRLAVHKALRGKRSKTRRPRVRRATGREPRDPPARPGAGWIALGQYHQFTIFDPKERLITAPCFRERVLHHAIMNVCEPVFERWLIADTYACRRARAGSPRCTVPSNSPAGSPASSSSTFASTSTASPTNPVVTAGAAVQGPPVARPASAGSSPASRPRPAAACLSAA